MHSFRLNPEWNHNCSYGPEVQAKLPSLFHTSLDHRTLGQGWFFLFCFFGVFFLCANMIKICGF